RATRRGRALAHRRGRGAGRGLHHRPPMLPTPAPVGSGPPREWASKCPALTSGDEDCPHLITPVETTPAPMADGERLPAIHHDLQPRDRLPTGPLADAGYVDAERLVPSRRDGDGERRGPTPGDLHGHAREAR